MSRRARLGEHAYKAARWARFEANSLLTHSVTTQTKEWKMSHAFKRVRSRRAVWLGGSLVALMAIAVALLVPTLGSAGSQAAPVNKKEPQISGVAVQGETLTATTGKWQNNPTSFAFQWRRCPPNGGLGDASNCSPIPGATTSGHLLRSADVGFTIRVRVTASNTDGSASAASFHTAVVTASSAPQNTSPPTISGTPQQGKTLVGDRGTWSGNPTDYNDFWVRCDKTGGSCANISGANNKAGYLLKAVDVGNTIRFEVQAKNANGSTFASSVPTAVIASATAPPPATGCPSGTGPVQVASVTPPARLLIDSQQSSPSVVHRGSQQITLRYHVSACGGRSVQGALVYATAVPFAQLSVPGEQPTASDGFAELSFRTLAGFPASRHQQLLAIFVRARKSGEDLLGGISTRRLFSVPVSLNG
jgi:hypothetical protein